MGRAAYYLLSPGTYKPNTKDSYDDELIRLFESENVRESSKNYLFPSQIYGFSGNSLDPEERTELNKYYLQSFRGQMEAYMDSPIYQEADDDTRAAMLTTLKDYYYDMTKAKYYGRVSPDSANILNKTQKAVSELETLGVAPYQTLTYKRMESDKDSDGNTIKNTKALKVRNAMEMEGTYETVLALIRSGKIEPGDVGLNKSVVDMDRSTYLDSYNSLADGTYTGLSTDSEGGTTSTGSKKKKGKRSSGRKSSGRKSGSSDLEKLYQKLYDMAINQTLDSIGDIASSMNSAAKRTVKDLVDDGESNHSALIRELEKMVAQQTK